MPKLLRLALLQTKTVPSSMSKLVKALMPVSIKIPAPVLRIEPEILEEKVAVPLSTSNKTAEALRRTLTANAVKNNL